MELDLTRLKVPVKKHDNCTVLDVSSGAFPRYIEVRMPGKDGARRTALWDGLLNLSNNDKVMCEEYPGNPVLRIVGFGGDQDAQATTIWTRTGTEIDPTNDADTVALYDETPTARIVLDPATAILPASLKMFSATGEERLELRGYTLATQPIIKFTKGGLNTTQLLFTVDIPGTDPSATWESSNGRFQWNKGHEITAGDLQISAGHVASKVNGFIVKNTSGVTAAAGDAGYLNASNEYKTTTTAEDERANPVAVLVGGANNADVYVTGGPGRATLNYAGAAPSSGDFLTFSTTAGSVQARSTMHSAILARARANGSGGTVEVELLLRTVFVPLSASNLLYRCNNHSDFKFTATINGAPTATSVVYTPVAGSENTIVPSAAGHLGLLRLHNTTRGNYRLVTAVNTGTNTITTISSVDDWADTDNIQADSSAPLAAIPFYEYELTQQTTIPELARAILIDARYGDTGGAGEIFTVHPVETYVFAKEFYLQNPNTTVPGRRFMSVRLIAQAWAHRGFASGAGTALQILAIAGAWVAV